MSWSRIRSCIPAALLAMPAACKPAGVQTTQRPADTSPATTAVADNTPANASIQIERITYQQWPDALRMSNGTVELVIVPQLSRIMRYGFVDGPNILWDDPAIYGQAVDAKSEHWQNFGGEKIWPWPQDDWMKATGRAWPPPMTSVPDQVIERGKGIVELRGGELPGVNVRIVRTIEMKRIGTDVLVSSRLERTTAIQPTTAPSISYAPWSIMQVPQPSWMMIRLAPEASQEGYQPVDAKKWPGLIRRDDRLTILPPLSAGAKLFSAGLELSAVIGDTLLVQRTDPSPQPIDPASRTQIYTQGDSVPKEQKSGPYVELEWASPLPKEPGQLGPPLNMTWTLTKIPPEFLKETMGQP